MNGKGLMLIQAAKDVSEQLGQVISTQGAPRQETWAEREQRLADGRSSPTGWPVKRIDDGLTIPAKPFKLDPNRPINVANMAKCGTISGGFKWL